MSFVSCFLVVVAVIVVCTCLYRCLFSGKNEEKDMKEKAKELKEKEERDMKEARRMELELLSWKGIHAEQSHRHRNKEGRCETARIILDVKGEM